MKDFRLLAMAMLLTWGVTAFAAPSISSLNPSSGSVGDSVTISGANFTGVTGTVAFNGLSATISSWSDTSIVVVVPNNAISGNVVVTAGGVASNGVIFTVLTPTPILSQGVTVSLGLAMQNGASVSVQMGDPADSFSKGVSVALAPVITNLSPISGAVGASVTITGTNFGAIQDRSTVSFNGVASTPTSWGASSIVVPVPAGAATNGNVMVAVNGVNTNGVAFTVTPAISGLSPNSGDPGSVVTITGTNFGTSQGTGGVTFNGLAAAVSSWSDRSLTVFVPNGATTGNVVVTTSAGLTSNGLSFTVTDTFAITLLQPTSGPIGSTVIITGGGFGATQGTSTVSFDGITATVSSWSDTQIVATVPPGAATGPVSITLSAAGTAVSALPFVVNATVRVTDSFGRASSYTSAMLGGAWQNTTASGSGCSSCTTRGTIQNSFDTSGNLISHTDELGHVTTYTYDSSGNMLSQSARLDSNTTITTSYTYNGFGKPLTVTDPLGNVTTNAYDANGNLLSITTPAPNSTTSASVIQFAYDSKGQLTQVTDPVGHASSLTYTPAGLIGTITDAQNNVTTYQYDSHGNRTAVIDALQNKTSFSYDAMDRLTTITYPDLTTTSFGYDARGRRTSVIGQNGKVTTYAYDDADRLVSITDAANLVTQYGYDTEDNLLSITDAAGHATSFSYDTFGRVTQTSFPSSLSETYTYDAVGNLSSKNDRKGQSILYVYDALNRLTHKGYPDSTGVDCVYDLAGRIKQVSDPTGLYGFAYDNMGRLIGTTTQYSFLPGNPSPTFSNAYAYDAASNRTQFTAPDGSSNTYQYDTLNRQTTLTSSVTGQFTFSYDALGRKTGLNRPNAVNTSYAYDSLSRLLNVLHQSGGATTDGASYTYDNAGNRASKVNKLNNVAEQYVFDAIYQLKQVTQGTTTTESYTYDAVGNRLSSLNVPSYSYNSSNQLTSTSTLSYTYDNNGNTLSKTTSGATTQYIWDFENRLRSVVLPGAGGTATFKYDPFGRRIQKSFTQGTTITTTNYLYDGENSIAELDQNANVLTRYTQTAVIDAPLAESRSGVVSYYQQDGLGSVTSMSSSGGSLATTYIYDSFGNLTASSGTTINPFQYTGRDYDPETGLRYHRARYYDQNTGRFNSEDPIGFRGGVNFYTYVSSNPVRFADPLGLQKAPPPKPNILGNCLSFALAYDQELGTIAGGFDEDLPGLRIATSKDPDWPTHYMPSLGCTSANCDDKVDCKKRRKIVLFVDLSNSLNFHAMLQQCNGLWASKNGGDPPVFDITGPPIDYYKKIYPTKGQIRTTCWNCPNR
jgi:RHS repeat-associated protein